MTALSRAFDEKLRARLVSLARALRSFKILKKKRGFRLIQPNTANTRQKRPNSATHGPHKEKYIKNLRKTLPKCQKGAELSQRTPPGSSMERKRCHKGAKGLPKGCQMEPTAPRRSPNGA